MKNIATLMGAIAISLTFAAGCASTTPGSQAPSGIRTTRLKAPAAPKVEGIQTDFDTKDTKVTTKKEKKGGGSTSGISADFSAFK